MRGALYREAVSRPAASVATTRALAVRFTRPNGSPTARFLVLVGGLSIFGPLCIDMYTPSLPSISTNLHASASLVQLSLTACFIGLALGQLVYGVMSDRHGRRRPLLVGLALFVAASFACAFAPNAWLLALFRLFEGLGAAAGLVISRAIVRDLFEGVSAAKVFSMMMLATGTGPIVAPQIGAALLTFTSWRGVFITLTLVGATLLTVAAIRIPETLAPEMRTEGRIGATLHAMRRVGASVDFLRPTLPASCGTGAIFAYVAGASFMIEDLYHASPQVFGLLFSLNAVGLVVVSQINAHTVKRFGSARMLTIGLLGSATSAVLLLVAVAIGFGGLPFAVVCMFGALAMLGFVSPNASALALQKFPDAAGSASALFGLSQFALAAVVAPLVGIGGTKTALPMALIMAILVVTALMLWFFLGRRAGATGVVRAGTGHLPTLATAEVE